MTHILKGHGDGGRGLSRPGWRGSTPLSGERANVVSQRNTYSYPLEGRAPSHNILLDSLPGEEYARLRPHLESITGAQGVVLAHSDRQISHVYFPTSALVALLVALEDGEAIEVGRVGTEGMVNLPVFWGDEKVHYTSILLQKGHALRMRADLFRREVKYTPALQKYLMRYTSLSFICAAQRTACNSSHSVKRRVASWLLTIRDHLRRNRFDATHEFIAGLLGVRRAGVSVVVNEFKQRGILLARRGQIEIIEPQKLEHVTCECYRIIKMELGHFRDARLNDAPYIAYARRVV